MFSEKICSSKLSHTILVNMHPCLYICYRSNGNAPCTTDFHLFYYRVGRSVKMSPTFERKKIIQCIPLIIPVFVNPVHANRRMQIEQCWKHSVTEQGTMYRINDQGTLWVVLSKKKVPLPWV